jgi:hypothetical protein
VAPFGKNCSNPFTPDFFHRGEDTQFVIDEHVVNQEGTEASTQESQSLVGRPGTGPTPSGASARPITVGRYRAVAIIKGLIGLERNNLR